MITEEMRIAERHRRYQLGSAALRVERIRDLGQHVEDPNDVQDSASMRLALHSLMVGSHAHRGVPT